jgi:hypothetical protein
MKHFGDLTRVDARLDISSASGLAKKILNGFKSSSADLDDKSAASPRLNLIFQQQVHIFLDKSSYDSESEIIIKPFFLFVEL